MLCTQITVEKSDSESESSCFLSELNSVLKGEVSLSRYYSHKIISRIINREFLQREKTSHKINYLPSKSSNFQNSTCSVFHKSRQIQRTWFEENPTIFSHFVSNPFFHFSRFSIHQSIDSRKTRWMPEIPGSISGQLRKNTIEWKFFSLNINDFCECKCV